MSAAIIFDLDGTLTVPVLDFDGIRAELGIESGPILEAMERMDDKQRALAEAVLERHEAEAARGSVLQDGAADTLAALQNRGYRLAVLTRNARRWTRFVLSKHGLTVNALRCREDGAIKPSAEPIRALCAELDCLPEESWMIGDHFFDISSGRAAGCTTVLLVNREPTPEYASEADHVIHRLPELLDLLVSGDAHRRP
jgi:HAD superfamily hydrolase (TIGR01509 family)